ncbi:hypothetical protein MUP77_07150 [Candidatus Bathyarchaeota archaeon]|nr:hypothetical protein [Candidatus Bathyarchaeota archaeon]
MKEEKTLGLSCARCKRQLGIYNGETFWIVWKGAVKFPPQVKILCDQCYAKQTKKEKAE